MTIAVPSLIRILMPNGRVTEMKLETYLAGAVFSAMGANAPLEALKSQAVASRTYAASAHRHPDVGAEVCTTAHCQDWKQVNPIVAPEVFRAVSETWGIIAVYDGKLIDAFFFENCDGHTRSAEDVHMPPVPYLQNVECRCGFAAVKGHGVGVCQRGAIVMARGGASFQEILQHYYQGVLVVPSGRDAADIQSTPVTPASRNRSVPPRTVSSKKPKAPSLSERKPKLAPKASVSKAPLSRRSAPATPAKAKEEKTIAPPRAPASPPAPRQVEKTEKQAVTERRAPEPTTPPLTPPISEPKSKVDPSPVTEPVVTPAPVEPAPTPPAEAVSPDTLDKAIESAAPLEETDAVIQVQVTRGPAEPVVQVQAEPSEPEAPQHPGAIDPAEPAAPTPAELTRETPASSAPSPAETTAELPPTSMPSAIPVDATAEDEPVVAAPVEPVQSEIALEEVAPPDTFGEVPAEPIEVPAYVAQLNNPSLLVESYAEAAVPEELILAAPSPELTEEPPIQIEQPPLPDMPNSIPEDALPSLEKVTKPVRVLVDHLPGERMIAGCLSCAGVMITVVDRLGNKTLVASGSAPHYGEGGFETIVEEDGCYLVAIDGMAIQVEVNGCTAFIHLP